MLVELTIAVDACRTLCWCKKMLGEALLSTNTAAAWVGEQSTMICGVDQACTWDARHKRTPSLCSLWLQRLCSRRFFFSVFPFPPPCCGVPHAAFPPGVTGSFASRASSDATSAPLPELARSASRLVRLRKKCSLSRPANGSKHVGAGCCC